jgi:cytochrome c553
VALSSGVDHRRFANSILAGNMTSVAKLLSDADIDNLATYIANLN